MKLIALLPLLVAGAGAQSGTVPLIVEGNVPMIDLEFVRADGSTHMGRFVIDSGGGAFLIGRKLAAAIGLQASGPVRKSGEGRFATAPPPNVNVGGMPLDLKGARIFILTDQDRVIERDAAEGLFPGSVLQRYRAIFDYPARRFTLAQPGSGQPRGTPVPSPVNRQNGFARLELTIGGRTFGFLLDTGASYTMISQTALEEWSAAATPAWPRHVGAVGSANMGLGIEPTALVVRIPEIRLGEFSITGAGAVSRTPGTFEKRMSGLMVAPIIGALGGNVLSQFRVEIDYAGGKTYLERGKQTAGADLNLIGLTLRPARDGGIAVAGVSAAADKVLQEQIKPGDLLHSIDGTSIKGLSLMQAIDRLRGEPGERKKLEFEREGKRFPVEASVTHVM